MVPLMVLVSNFLNRFLQTRKAVYDLICNLNDYKELQYLAILGNVITAQMDVYLKASIHCTAIKISKTCSY